jgi:hypothetical protein
LGQNGIVNCVKWKEWVQPITATTTVWAFCICLNGKWFCIWCLVITKNKSYLEPKPAVVPEHLPTIAQKTA